MYKYLILLLLFFTSSVHAAIRVTWPAVEHPDLAGYVVFRATPNPAAGWTQISSETELVTNTFFMAGNVKKKSAIQIKIVVITRYYLKPGRTISKICSAED